MLKTEKTLSKENALEALGNYELLDKTALLAITNMVKDEWMLVERDLGNPAMLHFRLTEKGIKEFKGGL